MDEIDENIFSEFVKMRKAIKKPLTDHAIKLARIKLERFKQQGHDVNEILNQSIFNSWQGLFEVKNGQINRPQGKGIGGERRRPAAEAAKRTITRIRSRSVGSPANIHPCDNGGRGTDSLDRQVIEIPQVEIKQIS